jgi:hypothetical protein
MPKPVLQSLILADHVYEDKLTGKRIIAGVFNRIIRGVKVVRQMGPPMPTPQPPPMPAAPPATSFYVPPPAAPAHAQPAVQPGHAAQTPAAQPAASQPASVPPATPLAPSQPGYAAPNTVPQPPQTPAAPAEHYGHSEQFGQTSEIIQPGQPVPPTPPAAPIPPAYVAPTPPTPPPPVPAAPQAYPTGQLGPPGTPLQPGQRVLEIPPTGLQSGSPFAYLSLTEIRGPNAFILELVNLSDDSQLFRSDLRVDCPDPLLTVEMTVPLPPISPQNAGIYALQLLHNNEILGSLRLIVEDAAQ